MPLYAPMAHKPVVSGLDPIPRVERTLRQLCVSVVHVPTMRSTPRLHRALGVGNAVLVIRDVHPRKT